MGINRANMPSLLIAATAKAKRAERHAAELRIIVHGLVTETRDLLSRLRSHVQPEGLAMLDEFLGVFEAHQERTPIDNPLRAEGKAPVAIYTEDDLKAVGG